MLLCIFKIMGNCCFASMGDQKSVAMGAQGAPKRRQDTHEPPEVVLSCHPNEQFLKINYSCVLKIMENCCFTSMGDQKSERMGPPDLGRMVKLRKKNTGFKKI